MKRLLWARVLRTMFGSVAGETPPNPRSRVKTVRSKRTGRPLLEQLESRLAPATFVWSGGGPDRNWSTGANWIGGIAPTAGTAPLDDLVFPANAGNRNAVNDLTVPGGFATFRSLTISGSNYALSGNGVRLGDASITSGSNIIVNGQASGNVISMDIRFAGAAGSRQFITVSPDLADVTISGRISGTSGVELTKGGIGTLTLSGDNSGFTGPITLDNFGGVVVISHPSALGSTTQPTRVGNRATLRIDNVQGAIAEPLILNGPGNDDLGALQNLRGNNVWTGPITLDSNVTVGGDAGSLEILGRISDTGAGRNLTKEGFANIILSAENTYRGVTTINNGVLTIRHSRALGADASSNPTNPAATGTVVNHTVTHRGTLALEDTSGTGLLVMDENLILNGLGFNDQGALNNLRGNNQWAGRFSNVILGELPPQVENRVYIGAQNVDGVQTELLISSQVIDKPGQTSLFSLQKVGPGKVILNNRNTYLGATIVREGTLTIRDSEALGAPAGAGTTVRDRATLELEVDSGFDPHGRPLGNDSVTGVQNRLDISEVLTINGVGVLNTGALKSLSGINRVMSQVILGVQASIAAIGVDPDPSPSSDDRYFTDDYSLTLTGGLADTSAANPTVLEKVQGGHLILPIANPGFRGVTIISQGWITAMNSAALGSYLTAGGGEPGYPLGQSPSALGQTVQPYVKVEDGAALHLRTATPAGSITVPQNVILAGNGITHPFALISGKGALMNLQGTNTLTGDVRLSGRAGIGVERTNLTNPSSVSELTLTGSMTDTTSFQIDPDRGARIGTTGEENSHIIDTGALTGSLTVVYDFRDAVFPNGSIPDRLRVYSPPRAFGGALLFDTGNVTGPGVFTVAYTTQANQPGAELVEIVVNEGGGASPAQGNSWYYQATFTPNLAVPQGGITKFGSKRLILQGDGTYTNEVVVQEGVLRVQNDTALGSAVAGTSVEAGAALEIARGIATNNGGIAAGLQIWGEQLTLSGPGNTTNGALIHPLTVLDEDNLWRGGVSLLTSATIDVKANARLNILRTIDDNGSSNPAGLTKVGLGELALAGANTYRGVTRVEEGVLTVQNGLALGAPGPDAGTEVLASATLQLQGDITVPGESLKIIGSGIGALPSLPIRWFNIGPGAVTNGQTPGNLTVSGGRVTSVAADPSDPNVLYLTAGTGGAWKSKDNGRTWLPLVDTVLGPNGQPLNVQTMYMSYVAVAPQDPRIIYLGTGEARSTMRPNVGNSDQYGGIGILKSTDGGKTWTLLQGKTNEFVGKAITKIVVDPGTTFRGVASQNIIYVTVATAAVAPPGTPAGNNGLWRYNGTGNNWTILTNAIDNPSPFRLSQNPAELRPGPDDDLAHHFHDTDDYTDVVVAINRASPGHRVIAFAIGSPDGGRATVSGTTITYNNGIFISVFSGDTVDFNNFKWRLAGFVTTQSIDDGFGAVSYPVPGVIKLGISSVNPGLKSNFDPGDYRLYASVAWPENGNDTTYNDAGLPRPYPLPPNPNGNNDGREGTLRSVQRLEINWDPNNGRYNVGSWNNTPAQPPSYLSTPKDSPHGTFEVGYGNYAQALIVLPGQTNPEADGETTDVVFLGGMGFPYAEGVLISRDGGSTWTDITTGADGLGPGAFIHNFGYDRGLLGGQPRVIVATDTGVFRLDNSTPGSIQWVSLNGNIAIGQVNGLDVHPTDLDVAYVGLQNNGTAAYTGAQAWRQIDNGSGGQVYVDPKFPNILYHVKSIPVGPGTASSGSMLRRSLDGGLTWTDILRLDAGTAQWSPLLYTTGGAPRPTVDTEVKYEPRSPFVVDPIETARLLAGVSSDVASNGVVLRESRDRGNTWTDLRVPTSQPGGLTLLSIDAIAAAQYQGVFQPDPDFPMVGDKGANEYVPETIYALAIYVDNAGVRHPRLAVTKNRGVSWSVRPFYSGTTELLDVVDIFVHPYRQDEVYAVRNTPTGAKVLRTTTAAADPDGPGPLLNAWENLTGNLPDLPVWTITVDPRNDNVYVGTDQGVYRLTNSAEPYNWERYGGDSMPNVQVRSLDLNQGLNVLTAGTYGRGVWQLFLPDYQVNGGVLRVVSGQAVWTGPVQLVGDTTIGAGGRQTAQGGRSIARLTILGEISDATPGANPTLRKVGQGDVILGGSNTYGGQTIVQEGVLVVTNPQALGLPGSGATIVRNDLFPNTALELQSDLLGEELQLLGHGVLINGHNTGVLRNVSNFNRYTGVARLLGDVTIGVDSNSSLTIAADTTTTPATVGRLDDNNGNFQVTKELTGLLVFQTANAYGGLTDVIQGALRVQHPLGLGRTTGGTQVRDGAQLQLENSPDPNNPGQFLDTVIVGEALTLSGTGINRSGALRNTAGNNVWRGPITLDRLPGFSPPTIPPTEVGFGVDRTADTLTIDGPIADTGDPLNPIGLVKILGQTAPGITFEGRLTLTSANSYGGLTRIEKGVLRIQNGAGLGTASMGTIVDATATLEIDGGTSGFTTLAEPLTLNGTGRGGQGALRNVAGNNVYTGNVTLASDTSIAVDAGTNLEVSGVVADPPPPVTTTAASLTKIGTGRLIFSGNNTYGGNTFINAGVLNIRRNTGLGIDATEIQEITVFGSAGTFRVSFNGATTGPLDLVSPTLASDLQTALNNLSTIGGVGGFVTVTRNGGIFRVAFDGSLRGQNVPQMTTTVQGGMTATVATIAEGTGASTVAAGATLQLEGGITVTTETLTLSGQGFQGQGALNNAAGNNTWSRPILLASDVFLGSDAGTLAINRPINQAQPDLNVTKVGVGTLDYQASNTYTGLTQVNNGTLLLNNAAGPSLAGNLTVGDGSGAADSARARWLFPNQMPSGGTVVVDSDGQIDLNGQSQTLAALRIRDGSATTGAAGNGLLTVSSLDMIGGLFTLATAGGRLILDGNVQATSSATESATIDGSGQVSLNGLTRTFHVPDGPQVSDLIVNAILSGTSGEGLLKTGAGRMELEKANTYTGPTTITAGDVQVDGSIGNVQLTNPAATLSGDGSVGQISGGSPAVGTINPGNNNPADPTGPYGILTASGAEWGPQTIFFVNLDDADANPATAPVPGVEHDQLVVNGNISLGGAILDGAITSGVKVGDRFTIIRTVGGTVSGRFAEPFGANVAFIRGQRFSVEYTPTTVILQREITDVDVSLTSSSQNNTSVYGETVVFTARVTLPNGGGAPVQTQATVTFTVDAGTPNALSRTKFLDPVTGTATFDPTEVFPNQPLSVGAHQVTVRFNGNSEYRGTDGPTLTQTVLKANTTTVVTVTPNPVFGQAVEVRATVAPVAPGAGVPSGDVQFTVVNLLTGATQQRIGTLSGGVATVVLTGLSVNSYRVDAVYAGDGNFNGSTSTQQEFTIVRASSQVTVTASPPSTALGQLATFNVSVTAVPPGSGTPTGQVTFRAIPTNPAGSPIVLGSRTLSGGNASLSTAGLPLGTYTIEVSYTGDGNFEANVGVLANYSVAGATTTTSLTASPATAVFGQAVRVVATIRRNIGAGVPTGTVTFTFPGGASPPIPVNAQGVAVFDIAQLPVGAQTVQADFLGTGEYGNSSGSTVVTVNRANTTATVTASVSPSARNTQVTFTATVRANAPGSGVPDTGTVTFVIDGVEHLPVGVDPNGRATIDWTFTTAGIHQVYARYNGPSDNYNPSPQIGPILQHRVVEFTSTTTLDKLPAGAATTQYGQAVGVTATVRGPNGQIVNTGTVTFFVDGLQFGLPVAVNANGRASVSIKAMTPGQRTIRAVFNGGGQFAGSNAEIEHTVVKANTATTLYAWPRSSVFGQAVTFTAVVAGPSGGFVPQGTVTFTLDPGTPNEVVIPDVPVNARGHAVLTRSNLSVGAHVVTAVFNENANYNASNLAQLGHTVNPPLPPVRLAAGLTPNPVAVQTPFTLTVYARDVNNQNAAGYNAPVSLQVISAPLGGVLAGSTSGNFNNGVAVFSGLTVTVGGRWRIRITSGALVVDLVFDTIGRQT